MFTGVRLASQRPLSFEEIRKYGNIDDLYHIINRILRDDIVTKRDLIYWGWTWSISTNLIIKYSKIRFLSWELSASIIL